MLGIIGRNGAGKSTLLRILTRITTPTAGRATIRGRVGSLLEVGTGFHPELTGRENVFLNGSVLGMKRRDIARKFPDIVEFAGVEQFIDTPVKRYSSGMSVRLAFAVAAHLEPEVLLDRRGARRRRRGVPAPLSRADGGPEPVGSHGHLRLAPDAGRLAALRAGDLDGQGRGRCSTARAPRSSPGTSSRASAAGRAVTWPDLETRARRRSRAAALGARRAGRRGGRRGRRPAPGRHRDRVHGAPPRRPAPSSRRSRSSISAATSPSTRWTRARAGRSRPSPGDYVSTAWIPGNLLNEGLTTVQVGICSLGAAKLRPHAGATDAVAFHVQDPGEGDSARGLFTGQWKGVVRPLLDWTTEER